jgi:dTDP-L-rhamnose 4-epimerase
VAALAALAATGAATDTATADAGFRAYNVASGRPATIGAMAAALAKTMDGPEPVVTGEFRAGDVRHIVASPEKAAREIGFRAEIPLDEGLAEFATAPLRA